MVNKGRFNCHQSLLLIIIVYVQNKRIFVIARSLPGRHHLFRYFAEKLLKDIGSGAGLSDWGWDTFCGWLRYFLRNSWRLLNCLPFFANRLICYWLFIFFKWWGLFNVFHCNLSTFIICLFLLSTNVFSRDRNKILGRTNGHRYIIGLLLIFYHVIAFGINHVLFVPNPFHRGLMGAFQVSVFKVCRIKKLFLCDIDGLKQAVVRPNTKVIFKCSRGF